MEGRVVGDASVDSQSAGWRGRTERTESERWEWALTEPLKVPEQLQGPSW